MSNISQLIIGPGVNHLFGNGAIFNRGSVAAEIDVVMNDDLTPGVLNAIKRIESAEPQYQWKAIKMDQCLSGLGFAEGCEFHSIITEYDPHASGSPPRKYFLMRERIRGVYAQLITAEVKARNDLRQLQEDVKSTASLRAQIVELSNQHITDCAQIDQLKSRLRSLGVEVA